MTGGAEAVNAGFPRLEKTEFMTAYPLAQVAFHHPDVPVEVRLEAFNPLVMGNADKSGIPLALLRYVLTNRSDAVVKATVFGKVPNYIGTDGWSGEPSGNRNEIREKQGLHGSERAIRNVKVKQMISGQFKSWKGAENFLILRSITDTALKNKQPVLIALNLIANLSLIWQGLIGYKKTNTRKQII